MFLDTFFFNFRDKNYLTSDWLYEFIWNQRIDVFGQRLYCFLSESQQKHLEHIIMVKQKFCV